MTRCSVANCYNSNQDYESDITLHAVPKDPILRMKWCNATDINQTNCIIYVCSKHFNISDYDERNLLKWNAVPSLIQACKICLACDIKLFDMNEKLSQLYEHIIGSQFQEDKQFPRKVCWECNNGLKMCNQLRDKAARSQALMMDLLNSTSYLTTELIKTIDRNANKLISKLSCKHYEPNHNDLHVHETSKSEIDDERDSIKNEIDYNFDDVDDILLCDIKKYSSNEHINKTKISDNEYDSSNESVKDEFRTKSKKVKHTNNIERLSRYRKRHKHTSNELLTIKNSSDEGINNENTRNKSKNVKNTSNKQAESNDNKYNKNNDVDSTDDKNTKIKNDLIIEYASTDSEYKVEIKTKHKRKKINNSKLKQSVVKRLRSKKSQIEKVEDKAEKIDRRKKPVHEVVNSEIFDIKELSVEEQEVDIEKRKETSNYKNSQYKCTVCYKGFLDEEAFKLHMTRHTEQSGAFICSTCHIHYKTQHSLLNHSRQAHLYKFICKKCSFVTTRRNAAQLHEKYHNGTTYVCSFCSEVFSKITTYMSHLRIKHPTDIVCQLCGHSFVSEKGLQLHRNFKHRFDDRAVPPDGPRCDKCNVRFISEEALKRHLKLSAKHNDQLKTTSRRSKEPKIAKPKESKRKADKNTTGKPTGPIDCEQCDMQLPDSRAYFRHFRRTHPEKNRTNYPSMPTKCMCEVCGRMFQSLALLRDHSFTHTDSKQFKCPQCDKCFQRKYRLITHRKVHGTSRIRHACPVCGKMFSTTGNMQRHMFTHTGLKPFKCEMCGKCFKTSGEKKNHVAFVHLKKPWPKRTRGKRRTDGRSGPQQDDMEIEPLWQGCADKMAMNDKPLYYSDRPTT